MKVKVTHKECFARQTVLVFKEVGKLTLHASLCGQFFWHVLCCFLWGVSLTRPVLFYVGRFSCTPLAVLCGGFLLHAPAVLYGEFLLQAPAVLCVDFLLPAPCCFMWGVCFTWPVLFYVGSFSYTPHAVLCGEFLLHAPCCFRWGVSLTHSILFYVGSFSYMPLLFYLRRFSYSPLLFYAGSFFYTPHAVLCGEFLLHAPCCFMWGVSLTRPFLFYAGSFSYTPQSLFCMEVFLQAPHFCDQKADKPMQEQGVFCEVCVLCFRSSKCQLSSKWHGKWTLGTQWMISWSSPLAFAFDWHSWSGYASVQTEAQSQHNHHPYTISHWILFHITCVLFLHAPCCCMLGVSLTHPVQLYVGRLPYTPSAMCFMSLSDSYTPSAVLCGEFVLYTLCFLCGIFFWHTPFCFVWGVCLRHPVLFYVGSFYFMWGVSISTIQPILFDIQSFCYI